MIKFLNNNSKQFFVFLLIVCVLMSCRARTNNYRITKETDVKNHVPLSLIVSNWAIGWIIVHFYFFLVRLYLIFYITQLVKDIPGVLLLKTLSQFMTLLPCYVMPVKILQEWFIQVTDYQNIKAFCKMWILLSLWIIKLISILSQAHGGV